jgi:hypothetical protein
VPTACGQAAEQGLPGRRIVEMEWLRIERRRELGDLRFIEDVGAAREPLSDVKFIQGEALSRASAARRVHTATLLGPGLFMSLA